jgi:integrase/recombinase XerD
MTDTAISPLRRRMIEDMTIRQLKPTTQHNYIRFVKEFSIFFGRSPDKAAFEDVRRYQLHLTSRGVSPGSINGALAALKFFFRITVQRFDIANHIQLVRQPRRLPVVLSPEEVTRLLEAARGPKYKAALAVAYGAGLRISEIVSLKVSDIDSKRMVIRVEQGKGRKDRYVMLSPHLLELLRTWWLVLRPRGYLFPGQDRISPLTQRQVRRACLEAAGVAGITKRVSPHCLRHYQPSRIMSDIFVSRSIFRQKQDIASR